MPSGHGFSSTCPNRLRRFFESRMNTFLKGYGVTSECIPYILLLSDDDGCSLKTLSEKIGVDRAHTTRVVSKLIDRGYIINSNPDGRAYSVHITEDGRELAAAIRHETAELSESLLSCFDESEREQWDSLWDKMNDRMDELMLRSCLVS